MTTPTARVLARLVERVGQLDQRLGAERVADLGTVDRDLRDPLGRLVADVLVLPGSNPFTGIQKSLIAAPNSSPQPARHLAFIRSVDLDAWLARAAARRPDRPALRRQTSGELHELPLAEPLQRAAVRAWLGPATASALALPPGRPFLAALHASLLLGAPAVPVDLRLVQQERAEQPRGARRSSPSRWHEGGAPFLTHFSTPAHAVATVVHTSGTTCGIAPDRPDDRQLGCRRARAPRWRGARPRSGRPLALARCRSATSAGSRSSSAARSMGRGRSSCTRRFDGDSHADARAPARGHVTLVSLVPTTLASACWTRAAAHVGVAALRVVIGGGPLAPALAAPRRRRPASRSHRPTA